MQGAARTELPGMRFSFHLLLIHCLGNTCSRVAGIGVAVCCHCSPSLLVQATVMMGGGCVRVP